MEEKRFTIEATSLISLRTNEWLTTRRVPIFS